MTHASKTGGTASREADESIQKTITIKAPEDDEDSESSKKHRKKGSSMSVNITVPDDVHVTGKIITSKKKSSVNEADGIANTIKMTLRDVMTPGDGVTVLDAIQDSKRDLARGSSLTKMSGSLKGKEVPSF